MKLSRRQSLKRVLAATSIPSGMLGARHTLPPPIRLVILDIGGTIIEDRGDVPEVLRQSLAHHDIESTPEEISRWRGASKREIIRHFVNKQSLPATADREKLTNVVYDEFTADLIGVYRSVPAIAGAEDAIRELRQSSISSPLPRVSIVQSLPRSLTVSAGTSTLQPSSVAMMSCRGDPPHSCCFMQWSQRESIMLRRSWRSGIRLSTCRPGPTPVSAR